MTRRPSERGRTEATSERDGTKGERESWREIDNEGDRGRDNEGEGDRDINGGERQRGRDNGG